VPKIGHYQAVCAEIIRLLREERKQRNLSNYIVSQKSGVSESMLSLVDRGLRNPSMELMLKIADGVGIDLPTFIKKAQETVSRKEK
jgi:transcriptional regulator with XRE-family HTH domain